jgi:hypothetical protein
MVRWQLYCNILFGGKVIPETKVLDENFDKNLTSFIIRYIIDIDIDIYWIHGLLI